MTAVEPPAEVDGRLLRGSRTREQLLRAALRLFGSKGFHATSMRDLATEAGVSPPSIYNHYASKEAILAAALVAGLKQFQGTVIAPDEDGMPSELRLEGLVRRHVGWQVQNRGDVRAADRLLEMVKTGELLPSSSTAEIEELLQRYRDLFNVLIDDLRDRRGLSLPSTHICVEAVLALCDSCNRWHESDDRDLVQVQNECWFFTANLLGLR
ncbi:TetR family transcriptional regulator [Gordonia sp. SID5947]|uniref:TetR family transcriptional regulator n=1 Tax=Gordonia sp. SID5947 TaxID=2690315 RepID=UPI00137104ED|nr:TetR family transcriptional regulator [Gordonia sp. SID5947]